MSILLDPRVFNFVIMGLYVLNATRWAVNSSWADVCYWLSAFAITATVTFGYRHSLADRGNDLYETPPEAVRALLAAERVPQRVWEPACGPGSIVGEIRRSGRECFASDLVDYGCPGQISGVDFLMERSAPEGVQGIVTNPPFKNAGPFVEKARELVPYVAMLLRLAFIESERRRTILDCGDLARVYVFRNRLPMMHRAGRGIVAPERQSSSALAFAWFVWDPSHSGPTSLHRISWRAA